MKYIFTSLFLWLNAVTLFSQTNVEGIQSGTWTQANAPYIVTDSIVVPAGEQLLIEPGVSVNFQGNYRFHIAGKLIAEGTEQDSIRFTAIDHSTGWGGLRFDNTTEISQLRYCKFTYGKTSGDSYPNQHGGAIMLDNSDIVISHSLFAYNEATAEDNGMGGALYGINTTQASQITACTFRDNHAYGEGGAVKLSGDNGLHMENCSFIGNSVQYGGGALCLYGCYDTHIYKCFFNGNYTIYAAGGAAYLEGYAARVRFVNCTMIGNQAVHGDGGGVELAFSDASFTNCIIYDNDGAYSDNIYLDYGYAEINYCNTPVPDDATGNHNINQNALFVNPSQGDFNLQENSPCVDTGIASLTITDAFGDEITVIDLSADAYAGSAPDMGCYERGYTAGNDESSVQKISIYPIPVNTYLSVQTEEQISNMLLYDINGKLIQDYSEEKAGKKLNLSFLNPGIYLLRVITEKGSFTQKIIKQ